MTVHILITEPVINVINHLQRQKENQLFKLKIMITEMTMTAVIIETQDVIITASPWKLMTLCQTKMQG